MKNTIHLDKLIQPFKYDEHILNNLLNIEGSNGVIIIHDLILFRCNIENNYTHCFQVNLFTDKETQTLGYLFWGSSNKMLNDIYFKVFNKRLYDGEVSITDIGEKLGLSINNLPCIDIAVDFNFNVIDKIYSLFNNLELEVIILNKVRDKAEYIPEIMNLGTGTLSHPYQYKGFILKGKDSHRLELNAYDKVLEIENQSPHKEYIREIEGFRNIFRLEVRVNGVQLQKTLRGLGISAEYFINNINDRSLQLTVWEHIINRLLRFRQRGKRECERIMDLLLSKGKTNQTEKTQSTIPHKRKRYRHSKRSMHANDINMFKA